MDGQKNGQNFFLFIIIRYRIVGDRESCKDLTRFFLKARSLVFVNRGGIHLSTPSFTKGYNYKNCLC
jgi:hypothetical protein